jgi:hypothetical protein
MTTAVTRKPRVLGIVGISILRGIVALITTLPVLQDIGANPQDYLSWAQPFYLVVLAIGLVLLVSAVLIALYKRVGLIIGGIVMVLDVVLGVLLLVTGQGAPNWIGLIITLAILYYIYKYLTTEPDRSYFT